MTIGQEREFIEKMLSLIDDKDEFDNRGDFQSAVETLVIQMLNAK